MYFCNPCVIKLVNLSKISQGTSEGQTEKSMSSGSALERPSTAGSSSSSPPVNPIANSTPAASSANVASRQQASVSGPKSQKWRCDVCNYETTIARNLRIHMTSEKHTHNMLILQQVGMHHAARPHCALHGRYTIDWLYCIVPYICDS